MESVSEITVLQQPGGLVYAISTGIDSLARRRLYNRACDEIERKTGHHYAMFDLDSLDGYNLMRPCHLGESCVAEEEIAAALEEDINQWEDVTAELDLSDRQRQMAALARYK